MKPNKMSLEQALERKRKKVTEVRAVLGKLSNELHRCKGKRPLSMGEVNFIDIKHQSNCTLLRVTFCDPNDAAKALISLATNINLLKLQGVTNVKLERKIAQQEA